MNLGDLALGILLVFVLLVSLANPGGIYVAFVVAALILGVRLFVPFAREYVVAVHSGKKGRAQQARLSADESRDSGKGGSD